MCTVDTETIRNLLIEATTLLEGCRGYFAYQTAQGDKFAPDAEWERPIIELLEKVKEVI